MTENNVRNAIGILVIVANIAVVLCTLILYFLGGFLYDEMTTTVALIVPMFSVYSTAIIKSIIAKRNVLIDNSPVVSKSFIFVSWLIPVAFIIYLVTLVFLKAFNIGFSTFEQFKGLLVASETIFGAYLGLVIRSMFTVETPQPSQTPPNAAV